MIIPSVLTQNNLQAQEKPASWYSVEIIVHTAPAGAALFDYLALAESIQ